MADPKEIKAGYLKPKRLSFPADAANLSWLSILLEAYYIVDMGIAEAIKMEERRGRKVACSMRCSNCCRTHKTIPVYPLELVGISWYVTEKITGPGREILRNQLENHKEDGPCPFLIDWVCSIHPMRPISCRQFIVFNKSCAEGEDPYYTRRVDVLDPIKKYVDKAFYIMLPFYGVSAKSERLKLIKSGAVHQIVKIMQTCNWHSLADKMSEFDNRIGRGKKI